ncbi:SRPBCC family protein [Streptomyces nigrescens]|uniref:SRPBCC family protein n=1 Tax=Streptomyces nigrescens TaxID=1920 RepID=UPI003700D7BA
MSGIRSTGVRAALFTAPLLLGLLGTAAAPAGAVGSHTSHPDKSLTCRGKGVDPDALVRHRTEIVINAPLRTVWKLQTDVERWPSWQPPVETVERLDHGPFRKGSAFRWTTPIPPNPSTPATSLDITSTVQQIKRNSCIRWTGPTTGRTDPPTGPAPAARQSAVQPDRRSDGPKETAQASIGQSSGSCSDSRRAGQLRHSAANSSTRSQSSPVRAAP